VVSAELSGVGPVDVVARVGLVGRLWEALAVPAAQLGSAARSRAVRVVVVQVVQVAQFRPAWAAQAADPAATQVEAVGREVSAAAPMAAGTCSRKPRAAPMAHPWRPTLPAPMAAKTHSCPTRAAGRGWATRVAAAIWARLREVRLDYPWPCWAPSSCWGDRAGVASDTTNHTRGDVLGVLDERDELHLSPATGASLDVKVESPAHQLAPRDVPTAVGGRSRRGVFVRWQRAVCGCIRICGDRFGWRWWNHQWPPFGVGGKYPAVAAIARIEC
jgi:hypothetical protein